MKKNICLLLLLFSVSVFAQTAPKYDSFQAGENLTYEVKFSKSILRGITVGELNFTVAALPDTGNFLITSEAQSKGTLIKLSGKNFYQNYKSTVDGKTLSILKTVKRDEQGDRIRESEAVFDYAEEKVTFVETDPNDAARAPRRAASPIQLDTQDIVTGIYAMRRLPLAVGKTFEIMISDSGLVYKIPVRVAARERQNSILGKVWCFRLEPEIFGTNRLIDNDGSMLLWITDDARRLPVRAQINANIGRFEVKLKENKGGKQK